MTIDHCEWYALPTLSHAGFDTDSLVAAVLANKLTARRTGRDGNDASGFLFQGQDLIEWQAGATHSPHPSIRPSAATHPDAEQHAADLIQARQEAATERESRATVAAMSPRQRDQQAIDRWDARVEAAMESQGINRAAAVRAVALADSELHASYLAAFTRINAGPHRHQYHDRHATKAAAAELHERATAYAGRHKVPLNKAKDAVVKQDGSLRRRLIAEANQR